MTVELITLTTRWQGLAADTKPTPTPRNGTRYEFLELDTDTLYVYDFDTPAWQAQSTLGTVTVSGGATAINQTTEIASLSVMDDWDESDRAKVNPIVGQAGVQGGSGVVTVTTQRTVLATDVALPAGTATIGGTLDAGPAWTTAKGVSDVPVTSADASAAAVAISDAPTSGQKIVVTDVIFSVGAALTVTFREETSGTVQAVFYAAANSSFQWTPRGKHKLATANKKLTVQTSGAGNITVLAYYYSEA